MNSPIIQKKCDTSSLRNIYHNDEERVGRKTYSQIGLNIGPQIEEDLLTYIHDESVTHLNLHANNIQSIQITDSPYEKRDHSDGYFLTLDSIKSIDLSSNDLGSQDNHDTTHLKAQVRNKCKHRSRNELSQQTIIDIVPNLHTLNLSANNLTMKSIPKLGFTTDKIMSNLKILNLSHNNIAVIPRNIPICCPFLVELNLANNMIQNLNNLNQLSTMHHLREFSIHTNPLCQNGRSYREEVILIISTLVKCDGESISEEERNVVSRKIHTRKVDTESKSITKCGNKPISLSSSGQKYFSFSERCQISDQNLENQNRMKNAVETLSLSKLNKIEYKIQKLTKLACEQVKVANQLRSSQHSNLQTIQEKNQSHELDPQDILDQERVTMVCDAMVQTQSIDELDSFKGLEIKDNETKDLDQQVKFIPLALGLYKWKIMTLQKKLTLNENRSEDSELTKVEKYIHGAINRKMEAIHTSHNDIKDNNIKTTELQKECMSLDSKLQQKEAEFSKLKELHKSDMNRIISEFKLVRRRNKANLATKTKLEKKEFLYQQQKAIQSRLLSDKNELKQALSILTQNNKRLEKKLKKEVRTIEEYKAKEEELMKKMKDVRKIMDIINRKSTESQSKLDCAKGAIQEAAKLARDRGEECNTLKYELGNTNDKLEMIKLKLEGERDTLRQELKVAKTAKQEVEKLIDEKIKAMEQYRKRVKNMKSEIESKRLDNSQLQKALIKAERKIKIATEEKYLLKKQLIQIKNQQNKCVKVESHQLQNDNDKLNKAMKQLEESNDNLQKKLKINESTICSLTKQLHDMNSFHEHVKQKIIFDHNTSSDVLRKAFEDQTKCHTNAIAELKNQLDIEASKNTSLEENITCLKHQLSVEKKNKFLIEKQLILTEQSLLDRTKEAQKALKSLCCYGLSTHDKQHHLTPRS